MDDKDRDGFGHDAPRAGLEAALRRQAEQIARGKASLSQDDVALMSPEDTHLLFHELRVHQIELEMQNEELRRAQVELDAASARYFDLYDLAPVGYCTLSEQGLILEANLTAATLLGVARSELVQRPISRFILKAHQDIYHQHRKQLMENGQAQTCELQMLKRDGTPFWAHLESTTGQDSSGAFMLRMALTDINQRKRAEAQSMQALRELNVVKAAIDEHAIVAVTDTKGKITYVNEKFCEISKYSHKELIGQDHRIISSGFHSKEFIRGLWHTISDGRVWKGELKNKAKDGSFYWVDTTIVPQLGEDGKPTQYIAIRADITERQHLDQVLQEKNIELARATAVAEKANIAKSDFLSSMSHELRSPLNAILGFAQLMEAGSPLPTPTQQAGIEQILKAGWYLLKLIDEILDLALIESGKLSLSLEPLSLSEILLDCQAMIEPIAQTSAIRIGFPQFDRPCFVNADRTRLKQVLINLLSNAIKYNRAGGTVEVTCSANTYGRIRISVHDRGQGLSAEKLEQLFQRFNRLGQEAGSKQGTGIGLVVSKRLVELMGGEIGVQSEPGVGSVFWIELNLASARDAASSTEELSARPRTPALNGAGIRTLLYVEDNPANMELVDQLIARRPDLRLLGAVDATQGIALARTHQPELILMDINLPGISGSHALKILREDPATKHIPVLAISANAMPHDIEKGLASGFFRYLTKPIRVNEFMETIDKALEFAMEESARAKKR